jgi:phosphatidylinositol dimannoside acyltransferase
MAKQVTIIIAQGLKALTLLTFFYPTRWAVQWLPWRWALKLGSLLGHLHARFIPDQLTRQVRAGIQSVWPNEVSKAELERIMRLNLVSRYKHLIDGFFYQYLDEQLIERMVPMIDNKAYLDETLNGGKGAILLVSHFGSFGMLIGGLALRGYRLCQIFTLTPQPLYRTWHWVERAIMRAKLRCWTHESVDFEFWRPGKYLRAIYRKLIDGEILVLYGDGARGRQFVSVDFMSYPLLLSVGPFRIAARAQVALIPAFILRQADDSHRIVLEKPIVLKADDSASILRAAEQYAALLAHYVHAYPDHWFTWARLRQGREDDRPVLELMSGKVDGADFYTADQSQKA